MSTSGKHAAIGLFYAGTALANKGYLVQVLNVAKNKSGGFGKYHFLSAEEFIGHADRRVDAVLIEGTVIPATQERISAAYKAIGKEVQVLSGSFEDEFRKYEREAGVRDGVTADPPANATDNVTASRGSPQAHVETDGRNDPKNWSHTTGTSLDFFGLPLATTDRNGASAQEQENGLDAQGQAVTERTAAAAASEADRAGAMAEASSGTAKESAKARKAAAQAERDAEQSAGATGGATGAAGSGDTGATGGTGATGATGGTGKAS